ncbi:isochorismatase family protein [Burkholderia humptydooensis]|nr:isochorismatase family protein [Burkholderia sp. 2002721687]
MNAPRASRRALLIVDMQHGLFNGPDRPHAGSRVLDNINRLIGKAREADAPVFAARHTGPQGSPIAPGSPLTRLLPDLAVRANVDTLFDKTRPNCFLGTGLAAWLADAGIDELVVTGMKTEYCVDTTCRAAADLGFRPVLVADAHTCHGHVGAIRSRDHRASQSDVERRVCDARRHRELPVLTSADRARPSDRLPGRAANAASSACRGMPRRERTPPRPKQTAGPKAGCSCDCPRDASAAPTRALRSGGSDRRRGPPGCATMTATC